MIMDFVITEERYQEVIDYMANWYGVNVTKEMIDQLVSKNHEILIEIVDGGYSDTCQREYILESFSKMITGKMWPMNKDSQDYKDEFYKVAKEKGFIK